MDKLSNAIGLKSFGFIDYGKWHLNRPELAELTGELVYYTRNPDNHHKNIENILYAFANENFVGYVGKTDGKIEKRLNNYQGELVKLYQDVYSNTLELQPKRKVIEELYDNLERERTIDILYYKPKNVKYMGGNDIEVNIDVISALEMPLISLFEPKWNVQGKGIFAKIKFNSELNNIF